MTELVVLTKTGRQVIIQPAPGAELPEGTVFELEETEAWEHDTGPGCPRNPCWGREDGCPNDRLKPAYFLKRID